MLPHLLATLLFSLTSILTTSQTLILSDNIETTKSTNSQFFDTLPTPPTYHIIDEPLSLFTKDNVLLYNTIYLYAPETEDLLSSLDTDPLTDYIKRGGNLMVVATPTNSQTSFLIRELCLKLGIQFNYNEETNQDIIYSNLNKNQDESLTINSNWLKLQSNWNIQYQGLTLTRASTLRQDAIRSHGGYTSETSLSQSYYTSLLSTRKKKALLVAIEGRNGARVIVSGSDTICSNAMFGTEDNSEKDSLDNRLLCNQMSKWLHKESGILKATIQTLKSNTEMEQVENENRKRMERKVLWEAGVASPLHVYMSNETVTMSVVLEEKKKEHKEKENKWKLYKTDVKNPIIINILSKKKIVSTTTLRDGVTKGIYMGDVQLPETYGKYVMQVLYQTPGYNVIERRRTVYVEPKERILNTSKIYSGICVVITMMKAYQLVFL